jgi:hypothetical protein
MYTYDRKHCKVIKKQMQQIAGQLQSALEKAVK